MAEVKNENASVSAVPEELKGFVDSEGKIDVAKVAQSMREAQQKITDATQESIAARRAYEAVVAGGSQPNAEAKGSGREAEALTVDKLVTDPEGTIDQRIDRKVGPTATAIVEALLAVEHPEVAKNEEGKYANPEFVAGLQKYAATLPPATRAAVAKGDYATSSHVIRTFKALQRKAADSASTGADEHREKPNFAESGRSASVKSSGKIFTRSEIREMYVRHPEEYRRRESEIDKAYEEGRVDFTK